MTFPALKHESLIICVSLSSILHPKCFHSTDFKFYSLFEGVHWKYLVFPCPFLIFLLTHSPSSLKSSWEQPYLKRKENFPILLISMEFPWCPFSISVDVFCWWQWCEQRQEDENFITEAVTEASISLMKLIKLIFLDSLSSLCSGKGLLQRAVTSFRGERGLATEINSLSLKLKNFKRLKSTLSYSRQRPNPSVVDLLLTWRKMFSVEWPLVYGAGQHPSALFQFS